MTHFECALPHEADAKLICKWREDPETARQSFTGEKAWPEFFDEYLQDYFCFPDLPPLFFLRDNKRFAFLRFTPAEHPLDPNVGCVEVSIMVEPSSRGKGVATECLRLAKEWIKVHDYQTCLAQVKEDNPASHKLFQSAGFKEVAKKDGVVQYLLKLKESRSPVFIIGEAGSNWKGGKENLAKELIVTAKESGCDAVKFQVFKAETTYVENAGMSDYLGDQRSITDIFKNIAMPYEMLEELFLFCQDQEIEFMASFFSEADFAAIDPFVKRHKIASYELEHIRLLDLAAKAKKPLFLSTGASTPEEIKRAVNRYSEKGGKDLTLMQCTAQYPAKVQNLAAISHIRHLFSVPVGLSDHSLDPLLAPVAAVALGASAVEKHFTLSKKLEGPDHSFAVEPHELKQMVHAIRETEKMLGCPVKRIDEEEQELYQFAKRGVQAIKEIKKGEPLIEGENIAILRPGKQVKGASPFEIEKMKTASRDFEKGEGITC